MARIPTTRIQNPSGEGFLTINASDYDERKHTLFVEGVAGQPVGEVPAGTPALDPNADPSLPNETATVDPPKRKKGRG